MNTNDTEMFENNKLVLYRVKFSLLLLLQIPAIILSLLIFIYFYKRRIVRQAPQNQALLILLVVNFIQLTCDLPNSLKFYHLGYISPSTSAYCTWWNFFSFTLYVTSEFLMATISVQRHMLVFNGHFLHVRWKRILLHKLPLLICLIYPMLFYIFSVVLYPCDGTQWDFTSNGCGFADCYLVYNRVLGAFDWSFNNGIPMIINALANMVLLLRIVKQKRRRQQRMIWRKQRAMTIQLFYISSLYIIAWTPCLTVGLVQILGYPTFLAEIQTDYFIDLIFIVCLFFPWVCLVLLRDLQKWIIELYVPVHANNIVRPM
jgi:hypothetical protein